jgi:predicted membrane protein
MNDQTSASVSEVPTTHVSPMGGLRRSGRVALRPKTTVVTLIGGVDLDLTDAIFPAEDVRLTKVSLVGGVSVVVPPDVRVELRGFSLVGGRNVERLRDVPAGARVLRISAWSIVGGVRVRVAG